MAGMKAARNRREADRGGPGRLERDRGLLSEIFCFTILKREGAEDDQEKATVGMQFILLGEFDQRLVLSKGCQRHLRLEPCRVRAPCPLRARAKTIRSSRIGIRA